MMDAGVDHRHDGRQKKEKKIHLSFLRVGMCDCFLNVKLQTGKTFIFFSPIFTWARLFKKRLDIQKSWDWITALTTTPFKPQQFSFFLNF